MPPWQVLKLTTHNYCPNWHRIDCKCIQSFWSSEAQTMWEWAATERACPASAVEAFSNLLAKSTRCTFPSNAALKTRLSEIIVDSRHSIDSDFSLSSPRSLVPLDSVTDQEQNYKIWKESTFVTGLRQSHKTSTKKTYICTSTHRRQKSRSPVNY